ncbi:MAG TPA: glycosyltransferase family 1 protein [Candidatus Dormibacteraeota bacterium]|nr:glycosyltransferase family 1 protein [Candidatus Dormibacteraeota bacterium]
MTRVLIDGRALYDGNRFRGIGVYLRQLVDHMQPPPGLDVSVLVTGDTALPTGLRAERVSRRLSNRFASREHRLRLPGDLRRLSFDVYHSPSQEPPRRMDRPWIQTMHDATEHPSLVADRERWRRLATRICSAAAIITPSEYARRVVVELLGCDPGQVHAVHHGVDARFRPEPSVRDEGDPYILMVSEYGPWKGYPEAFQVASHLRSAGLPHRLKVVGRLAAWVRPQVERLVAESGASERIDLLDYVPEQHLARVYQGASALVVTSHMEGFGLPLVEAMASGVPVVGFDNTAIPEVVGDGGVIVPDGNVSAMTEEILALLRDQSRWLALSESGLRRAQAFDWRRSAERHIRLYLEVAA